MPDRVARPPAPQAGRLRPEPAALLRLLVLGRGGVPARPELRRAARETPKSGPGGRTLRHHGNGAGGQAGSASPEAGRTCTLTNGSAVRATGPPLGGRGRARSPPTPRAVWAALGAAAGALTRDARCRDGTLLRGRPESHGSMQGSARRPGTMTDVHRRFLQLLLTHGVLEEADAQRLQRHCYRVHDCSAPVEKLGDFINNINSVLESLYIEIKRGLTEDDGRPVYALVNLATTPISKMASDFQENELDLFRKALELIIDSDTGFASSTNILNLVDQLKGKKMRKKEAEHVLHKFVQSKWLTEKEGHFTLHSRAILEMEQYIREMYPEAMKVCNICHSLLIQGQSCETCGIRMHLPCVAKYFQASAEPRCPHCNDHWPHEIPEVFHPEKHRDSVGARPSKKPSRSRQH